MTSFLAQNDEVCYELCMGKDGGSGRCRKCHGFGYEHRATGLEVLQLSSMSSMSSGSARNVGHLGFAFHVLVPSSLSHVEL